MVTKTEELDQEVWTPQRLIGNWIWNLLGSLPPSWYGSEAGRVSGPSTGELEQGLPRSVPSCTARGGGRSKVWRKCWLGRGYYTNATVEKTCSIQENGWHGRWAWNPQCFLRFAPSDFSDSQGFLRFVRQILKGPWWILGVHLPLSLILAFLVIGPSHPVSCPTVKGPQCWWNGGEHQAWSRKSARQLNVCYNRFCLDVSHHEKRRHQEHG